MADARGTSWLVLATLAILVLGSFAGSVASVRATAPTTATAAASSASDAGRSTPGAEYGVPAAPPAPSAPVGSLSAGGSSPASPAVAGAASTATQMTTKVAALQSAGVPLRDAFLPNLNANPHPALSPSGTVQLGYAAAPAPIGVAEYGIANRSGVLTPLNLTTTSLLGTYWGGNELCKDCQPKVLSFGTSDPDWYGLQLNAVLHNVTLLGVPGYQFWTQYVIEYSTYLHELFLVTNIWNFSSPAMYFSPNALVSHGPHGVVVPGELYYSVTGPFDVGTNYTATLNLTTSTQIGGDNEVTFHYDIAQGATHYSGENDYAIFNSKSAGGVGAAVAAQYVASGSTYTPLGIPSDWEFDLGGPGGGSNVDIFSMYATIDLYYWNATAGKYQVVPQAYDVGSETGETSTGASALWEGDVSKKIQPKIGGPGEWLVAGPTYLHGLWGIDPTSQGYAELVVGTSPETAFVFLAPQTTEPYDWESFAWAPPGYGYWLVAPGSYSYWVVAADYDPQDGVLGLVANNSPARIASVALTLNLLDGVYTPLWALNDSGLADISYSSAAGDYAIFDNQYAPLGVNDVWGLDFPWFGEGNDYLYPVFPGILLWNLNFPDYATIYNPPSLATVYPSWEQPANVAHGLPLTNTLPMLFYNTNETELLGGTDISGWSLSPAQFGPTTSDYNVVFWNSSYAVIADNTFNTGSDALFLYGGIDNEVFNNSFYQAIPYAVNETLISGYYFGTYALLEADFGDYLEHPVGYHDVIYNNIFDTYFTAYNPTIDPYTGAPPRLPVEAEWNVTARPGLNILGGHTIGGNYWWNYGNYENPYQFLPYENWQAYYTLIWGLDYDGIAFGGDWLPLLLAPVYHVTFVETGLTLGVPWAIEVGTDLGDVDSNESVGSESNMSLPNGTYDVVTGELAGAGVEWYTYIGPTSITVDGTTVVAVEFAHLVVAAFHEKGLPAGTEWYVEAEQEVSPYTFLDNFSEGAWVNLTVVPGDTYFTYVGTSAEYALAEPYAYITPEANTTYTVDFLALTNLTFVVTGLPGNTFWTIAITSDSPDGNGSIWGYGSGELVLGVYADFVYNWSALSLGYTASPASGVVTLHAPTTVDVAFTASASIEFAETGLADGTAWTVVLTQGATVQQATSTSTSIAFSAVVGPYSYTVSAAGYGATPASGEGDLPVVGPVAIAFAPVGGTLEGKVAPGAASLTIGGTAETLGAGGSYSIPLAPGKHAIVVTDPGYFPYYGNVTIVAATTAYLNVTLHPVTTTKAASTFLGVSGSGWGLVAGLAVLVVVLLGTTVYFLGRSRRPPQMAPYSATAAGGAPPPPGTPPAWSESGPGNPPTGSS